MKLKGMLFATPSRLAEMKGSLGRVEPVRGYRVVDVAVVGGNALLGSIAAFRSLRSGFTTLLAVDRSFAETPEGLLEDHDFATWVKRTLHGEASTVSFGRGRVTGDVIGTVAALVSQGRGAGSLAVAPPGRHVSVSHVTPKGEVVLVHRDLPADSGVAEDPRASRLVDACRSPKDVRDAGCTVTFAKRVVVCGMRTGLAFSEFERMDGEMRVVWKAPGLFGYGSAATLPFTAARAVEVLAKGVEDLWHGKHLSGLAA